MWDLLTLHIMYVHTCTCGFESHLRQMGEYVSTQTRVSSSFFLGKVTALGVLCYFALLFV